MGDENGAAAQPESNEDVQPLMLVFKLVECSCRVEASCRFFLLLYMIWWLLSRLYYMICCLLFLLYYLVWWLLTVMVILACSVAIFKLAYHEQHDAGDQVDHNAPHIPEIPIEENYEMHEIEDHLQAGNQLDNHPIETKGERKEQKKKKKNKIKNKVDHKAQHTPEIPMEEKYEMHEIEDHPQAGNQLDKHPIETNRESKEPKKKKKNNIKNKVDHKAQHTPEIPIEEKYEIHEIEDHLQAGNQLDNHPIETNGERREQKKKKKKNNNNGVWGGICAGFILAVELLAGLGGIVSGS